MLLPHTMQIILRNSNFPTVKSLPNPRKLWESWSKLPDIRQLGIDNEVDSTPFIAETHKMHPFAGGELRGSPPLVAVEGYPEPGRPEKEPESSSLSLADIAVEGYPEQGGSKSLEINGSQEAHGTPLLAELAGKLGKSERTIKMMQWLDENAPASTYISDQKSVSTKFNALIYCNCQKYVRIFAKLY